MKKISLLIIGLILTIPQCTKVDQPRNEGDYDFAIYLLKNSELKIRDIITKELSEQDSQALYSIELEPNPWLTIDDLNFYDFSSHIIYLKQNKNYLFPPPVDGLYPGSWWDKPFMVIANGQRRYVGIFRGGLSNEIDWPFPYITDFKNLVQYPSDLIVISWIWFSSSLIDGRNDLVVKNSLSRANVIHYGLNLKLNKIIFTDNSDTSTVEYTYSLINYDTDNLYVIDPDLMGTELFHFINNGPYFHNYYENKMYESKFKKVTTPPASDYLDPGWFVKINSGDSITRTVTLKGYPHFPSGIYFCQLSFQSFYKIPEFQRTLPSGRYWIGPTVSNTVTLQY